MFETFPFFSFKLEFSILGLKMDFHGKTIACWQIKIQTGVLIMKGTSNGIFMKHQIQVFAQRGKMSRISKVSEKKTNDFII